MGGIIKNISQRVLKKTNVMKKGREVTEIIVSREVILKKYQGSRSRNMWNDELLERYVYCQRCFTMEDTLDTTLAQIYPREVIQTCL